MPREVVTSLSETGCSYSMDWSPRMERWEEICPLVWWGQLRLTFWCRWRAWCWGFHQGLSVLDIFWRRGIRLANHNLDAKTWFSNFFYSVGGRRDLWHQCRGWAKWLAMGQRYRECLRDRADLLLTRRGGKSHQLTSSHCLFKYLFLSNIAEHLPTACCWQEHPRQKARWFWPRQVRKCEDIAFSY